MEVTFKVKGDKWKQGQKNKTKTQTEDKENAEADDVRYQFLSRKSHKMDVLCSTEKSLTYNSYFIEHLQWRSDNLWIW